MKRPPAINITLDYLYGFQGFDKRRTLHYVHIYYAGLNSGKRKKDRVGKRTKAEINNTT